MNENKTTKDTDYKGTPLPTPSGASNGMSPASSTTHEGRTSAIGQHPETSPIS